MIPCAQSVYEAWNRQCACYVDGGLTDGGDTRFGTANGWRGNNDQGPHGCQEFQKFVGSCIHQHEFKTYPIRHIQE
jgi:hypothetical protein